MCSPDRCGTMVYRQIDAASSVGRQLWSFSINCWVDLLYALHFIRLGAIITKRSSGLFVHLFDQNQFADEAVRSSLPIGIAPLRQNCVVSLLYACLPIRDATFSDT